MRKLTAILFLAILVFNFCGYKLVLSGLQAEVATAIENKVDQQAYADSELISLKTTLHLAYYNSSPTFERAYGSVTINGADYEYVKRRVYNDTLEVLCIPNTAKTNLKTASADMAKASADGQASTPIKKSGTTLKISLPDYCQAVKTGLTNSAAIIARTYFLSDTHLFATAYTAQRERPPQSMPA